MEHHLIYMLMIDFANHFCIFFQKNFNIFPFSRQIGDFCRFQQLLKPDGDTSVRLRKFLNSSLQQRGTGGNRLREPFQDGP